MAQTMMSLYGTFDVATGNLIGVCPINGVTSSIAGTPVTVTGTPTVGSVLTAAVGSGWTAGSYQWTRDGANISGATSVTYTLVSADAGHTVAVNTIGLASKASTVVA